VNIRINNIYIYVINFVIESELLPLEYPDQTVNAVYENRFDLSWEPYQAYRYSVDKMKSYFITETLR